MGFEATATDQCVYTNKERELTVLIYVDDGLVFGKKIEDCLWVVESLNKHFKTKVLTDNNFLGMELTRKGNLMKLSQFRYAKDIIERFNLSEAA